MGFGPGTEANVWEALTGSLGLSGVALGQKRRTSAGAPTLSGVVEGIREGNHPFALLLLDEPAPGAAFLNACAMGDQVLIAIGFYLYGDRAAGARSRDEPLWQAWMSEHYPAVNEATGG